MAAAFGADGGRFVAVRWWRPPEYGKLEAMTIETAPGLRTPPIATSAVRPPLALRLLRELAIGVALCTGVAMFLSLAFNDPFWRTMVFSLCIGLTCQLLIDGGRRLAARWLARRRPKDPSLHNGWPGWHWTLPIVLVGSLVGIQIGYPLAGWLLGLHVRNPGLDQPRLLLVVLSVSVVAALIMVYGSWSRARIAASHAQAEAAQRLAAESQLRLLESQLEPHMLFNTLANLRVLIGSDAERAQAMLDRLIAFLRATLQASRTRAHALSDEFSRLEDYLALMAVRMGPRLSVSFELPAALAALPLPPLLLQPLVENSIKHGLEPQVAGGRIAVRAFIEGDALVLSVEDDGVGLTSAADAGGSRFGLAQVRERLASLYGSAATLTLAPAARHGTSARIRLPLAALRTASPAPPDRNPH